METIINISEGYKAVLLPKDAEKIEKLNKESMPISLMVFKANGSASPIHIGFDFELIGLLNEISEDQAREIMGFDQDFNLEALKLEISSKGVLLENPYKKVEFHEWCMPEGHSYIEVLKKRDRAWEASERDCKKILIIKCKEE